MSGDLDHVIAAALTGIGEGIAGLRASGASVELVACSIEVDVDDIGPAARLTVELRPDVARGMWAEPVDG